MLQLPSQLLVQPRGVQTEHTGSCWSLLGDDASHEAAANTGCSTPGWWRLEGEGTRDIQVAVRGSQGSNFPFCSISVPLGAPSCAPTCLLSRCPARHVPTCAIPGKNDPLWGSIPCMHSPWDARAAACLPAWGEWWWSHRSPLVPRNGVLSPHHTVNGAPSHPSELLILLLPGPA